MRRIAMLLAALGCFACGHLTPAQKAGVEVITCRYKVYVKADGALNEDQKAMRLKMTDDLRKSLGLGECKEVGR